MSAAPANAPELSAHPCGGFIAQPQLTGDFGPLTEAVQPLTSDEISALRAMARVVLSQNTEAHAQALIQQVGKELRQAGMALQHAALALKDADKMPVARAAAQASQHALKQAKGLVG